MAKVCQCNKQLIPKRVEPKDSAPVILHLCPSCDRLADMTVDPKKFEAYLAHGNAPWPDEGGSDG